VNIFRSRFVSEENERFFVITQVAYLIGFTGHTYAYFGFREFGILEGAWFNLFYSIPCFAVAFALNWLGKHNLAFSLAFMELVLHQVMATYYLGWDFGAHFWLIYLAGLVFFNPSWKPKLQVGLLALILGSYVYLYLYHQVGLYQVNEAAKSWNRLSSALATIMIISLLINYYSRAANKAETRLKAEKEKTSALLRKVEALFGQQVSEEIALELISNEIDFSSRQYDVSVLFLDIRDFTVFADAHEPDAVARFQNTVFGELIPIVKAHQGVVLQILGDGIMAVFGAPVADAGHAQKSVAAALNMLESVETLVAKGSIPPTRLGIGINSGQVIAGNVGNAARKFYSLTGKNVIIAARLEQLNKPLKSQLLISEHTYRQLNRPPKADFVGKQALKGIEEDVGVYRLA